MSEKMMDNMEILFTTRPSETCCLCGSTENLSGEHKIKASKIRDEFGSEKMVIGVFGESIENLRDVQGPKSKNLHFQAKICRKCNSQRTQAADKEFDKFHYLVRENMEKGDDPSSVFELSRYAEGSYEYLNLFRYFAKLLCCQLGAVHGPIPLRLARFAISELDKNCVYLKIDRDDVYQDITQAYGDNGYAAQGGLGVWRSKKFGRITDFLSTLTIGPVKYVYFMKTEPLEQLELLLLHSNFYELVKNKSIDHM